MNNKAGSKERQNHRHQKLFYVEVWSVGEFLASGEGTTKKEAEQKAARLALRRLRDAEVSTGTE